MCHFCFLGSSLRYLFIWHVYILFCPHLKNHTNFVYFSHMVKKCNCLQNVLCIWNSFHFIFIFCLEESNVTVYGGLSCDLRCCAYFFLLVQLLVEKPHCFAVTALLYRYISLESLLKDVQKVSCNFKFLVNKGVRNFPIAYSRPE